MPLDDAVISGAKQLRERITQHRFWSTWGPFPSVIDSLLLFSKFAVPDDHERKLIEVYRDICNLLHLRTNFGWYCVIQGFDWTKGDGFIAPPSSEPQMHMGTRGTAGTPISA